MLKIRGTTIPQQIKLENLGVAAGKGLEEKNCCIVESLLSSVLIEEIFEGSLY